MTRLQRRDAESWIGLSFIFTGLTTIVFGLGILLARHADPELWKFCFIIGCVVTFSGYVLRVVNDNSA